MFSVFVANATSQIITPSERHAPIDIFGAEGFLGDVTAVGGLDLFATLAVNVEAHQGQEMSLPS
jgi:hypothetical protein